MFVFVFSIDICICVQWCQSKKSKTGCPGIPQFKYTRSSTGFPCYWDPKRCADDYDDDGNDDGDVVGLPLK